MNSTPAMEPRFQPYTLRGILPEGDVLILNTEQGILSQLHAGMISEQQALSPSEMYVVQSLFDNYPDYCPYEAVLSAMTGKNLDACNRRVNWGIENNALDVVMRPVRNLLGRCREKLHPFGIEVKSLVHTGYVLVPAKAGTWRQK